MNCRKLYRGVHEELAGFVGGARFLGFNGDGFGVGAEGRDAHRRAGDR